MPMTEQIEQAQRVIDLQKRVILEQHEEILALKHELARQKCHTFRSTPNMVGFMTNSNKCANGCSDKYLRMETRPGAFVWQCTSCGNEQAVLR